MHEMIERLFWLVLVPIAIFCGVAFEYQRFQSYKKRFPDLTYFDLIVLEENLVILDKK